MATNLDNLKTYWEGQVNAQTSWNDGRKYEALAALDDWMSVAAAYATAMSTDISSYSIAGRSVARRQQGELRQARDDARAAFMVHLYGNVTVADFSNPVGDAVDDI